MKIFKENNTVQAQDKICFNKELKKIIQRLNKAGELVGDDDLTLDELEQAQSILDNLILCIKDKNAPLVYFSGSATEFAKQKNRIKKENVEVICDDDTEFDIMADIMNMAAFATSGMGQEECLGQPMSTVHICRRADYEQ